MNDEFNNTTPLSAAPVGAQSPSNRFQTAATTLVGPDGLIEEDRTRLCRTLTPEVIAARVYRSIIRRADLPPEYAEYQRKSGLFITRRPILVDGPDGSQLRPYRPRKRRGKLVKYESPLGQINAIDAHPFVRPLLPRADVPLFVTEGLVKSDAAVAAGLCCVTLCGVWSWRGARERGGPPLALPDWDAIALRGRVVVLAFDADVMTKKSVYSALVRLKAFLARKGADVRILYLEHGDLEDFFAEGYARAAA